MQPTVNAVALAQAVIAGNGQAVVALMDCVMEEMDLSAERELIDLWGKTAIACMGAMSAEPAEQWDQYKEWA